MKTPDPKVDTLPDPDAATARWPKRGGVAGELVVIVASDTLSAETGTRQTLVEFHQPAGKVRAVVLLHPTAPPRVKQAEAYNVNPATLERLARIYQRRSCPITTYPLNH